MSFVVYDIIFLTLFIVIGGIFLYRHRGRAKWEGPIILYRTQVGIKFIDYVDQHYGKYLSKLKWIIILTGYVSMAVMTFLLLQMLYIFIKRPDVVRAVKIPPLAPLIPYLPELFKVDFLPPFYFTYWILAIAVIALSHEFAHGIFAKINNVRVKSTGFGFLGPFLAAFVEPDEEEMQKIKKSDQLAILGAGSFANLIMTVLFLVLLGGFFALSFAPGGVVFNTYAFEVVNISDIQSIGGVDVSQTGLLDALSPQYQDSRKDISIDGHNFTAASVQGEKFYLDMILTQEHAKADLSYTLAYLETPALLAGLRGVITGIDSAKINNHADLQEVLGKKKPGETVQITTLFEGKEEAKEISLGAHPETGKAFLGVSLIQSGSRGFLGKLRNFALFFRDPHTYYKPKFNHGLIVFIYDLLWWIILINLSVALVNMLPLGIFDGGRVFYVTMWGLLKSERWAKKMYRIATYFLLAIFALLMIAWAWHIF